MFTGQLAAGWSTQCWCQMVLRACSPSLVSLPLPGLLRLLCLVRSHLPRLDLCGGQGGQSPLSAAVHPGCRPTGWRHGEAHGGPPTRPQARPVRHRRWPTFLPTTARPICPRWRRPRPQPEQASALPWASLAWKAPLLSFAEECSWPRREDLKLPSLQLASKLYGRGILRQRRSLTINFWSEFCISSTFCFCSQRKGSAGINGAT